MNWQPISKQNPEIGRIDLRHDVVTLNRKEVNTDEIPESRTGKAGATLCTRRSGTRWRWRFQNRNRLPEPRREPRFQDRNPFRKQVGSSWLLRIRGPGAMVTHCLTGSRFGWGR